MNKNENKKLYTANAIVKLMENEQLKILAITSSISYKNPGKQTAIIQKITQSINDIGQKAVCYSITNDFEKIEQTLNNNNDSENNIILIDLLNIQKDFKSLNIASICGKVVLLEKYENTSRKKFEDLIQLSKQNNIKISGIITY